MASIVKKSNTKLQELKSELHELESQIILTQANSNGKGEQNINLEKIICKAMTPVQDDRDILAFYDESV